MVGAGFCPLGELVQGDGYGRRPPGRSPGRRPPAGGGDDAEHHGLRPYRHLAETKYPTEEKP